MNINFFICSVLSFFPLYLAIKNSEYKVLKIFIYLNIFWIPYTFNGMRQGIAMSIFFLIISKKNNFLINLILVIIAYGYHKSIILISILYLVAKIVSKKINIKVLNQITLIFAFVGIILSKYCIKFLEDFIPKLKYFSENFSNYSVKGICLRFVIFFIFIYLTKYIKGKKMKDIYVFYCIGLILYCFLSAQYLFSTRINMFVRIVELYLIGKAILHIKSLKKKIIIFLFFSVVYGSVYIKEIYMEENSPYRINPYFKELVIKWLN